MRSILSEKSLVVVLFVVVLITFSLAQEDSRKMEKIFIGTSVSATPLNFVQPSKTLADQPAKVQDLKKPVAE
jgi:cell shape-determining protein MreC